MKPYPTYTSHSWLVAMPSEPTRKPVDQNAADATIARRGPPVSTQVPKTRRAEAEHHDRDREDDPDRRSARCRSGRPGRPCRRWWRRPGRCRGGRRGPRAGRASGCSRLRRRCARDRERSGTWHDLPRRRVRCDPPQLLPETAVFNHPRIDERSSPYAERRAPPLRRRADRPRPRRGLVVLVGRPAGARRHLRGVRRGARRRGREERRRRVGAQRRGPDARPPGRRRDGRVRLPGRVDRPVRGGPAGRARSSARRRRACRCWPPRSAAAPGCRRAPRRSCR